MAGSSDEFFLINQRSQIGRWKGNTRNQLEADCGGHRGQAGGSGLMRVSSKRPTVSPGDGLETFVELRFAGWPERA